MLERKLSDADYDVPEETWIVFIVCSGLKARLLKKMESISGVEVEINDANNAPFVTIHTLEHLEEALRILWKRKWAFSL